MADGKPSKPRLPGSGVVLRAESILAQTDHVEGGSLPGDYFVLDLESGNYYSLGEVGGFAWSLLDGERDLGVIARAIVKGFTIEEEEAVIDLLEFGSMLMEFDLVRDIAR